MNQIDIQNIVNHELGHVLSLGHSNYSKDVMYSTVQYRTIVKPISSLDLYVVSKIFEWAQNFTTVDLTNICPQKSQIELPPNVRYFHLPVALENSPVTPPQTLPENIFNLFSQVENLIIVTTPVVIMIIFTLILKRKKPQK
jgi:hypothetical protein